MTFYNLSTCLKSVVLNLCIYIIHGVGVANLLARNMGYLISVSSPVCQFPNYYQFTKIKSFCLGGGCHKSFGEIWWLLLAS